jgi:hypothetical protein
LQTEAGPDVDDNEVAEIRLERDKRGIKDEMEQNVLRDVLIRR